jgi:hypothetical protein
MSSRFSRYARLGFLAGIPLMIGSVIARAYDTSWIATNQPVSAMQLKAALDEAQTRIAALEAAVGQVSSDCPSGYAQDASVTQFVVCKKGVDEVVKVGTGASVFWIDRYEASLFEKPDGSGVRYSDASASSFPASGQIGNGQAVLYALSVPGVAPTVNVTWFQANRACRVSGKRLPDGAEWLEAASDTPDPGANDGTTNNKCNTSSAGPRNTGNGSGCASSFGAQDMIGNLNEWTADWVAGPGTSGPTISPNVVWPGALYNGDATANVSGSVYGPLPNNDKISGLPSAVLRGYSYGDGTIAGIFAYVPDHSPASGNKYIGFRCLIPR